jgi:hypothetical protein
LFFPHEVIGVLDEVLISGEHCCSFLVDVLDGAQGVLLLAADGDDPILARDFDDVVGMVCGRHKLCQCQIAANGVVREDDVHDVKVELLYAVDEGLTRQMS